MTRFHDQQQDQQASAQISSDLVARMNRVEQQMETGASKPVENEGEISAESVDFGSVLKSVSPEAPDPLPEVLAQSSAKTAPGDVHRDRNLSSIIGMIRDEGPAGEETPAELAEDVLDISTPAEPATAEEPEVVVPPETPPLTMGEQGASSVGPFLKALVMLLVLVVSGLAFLTWQQMQRQEELEAKVKAAQQMLGLIDERYRELEVRTAATTTLDGDLVHHSELQEALARQQRQFADELLLFTTLLAPRTPAAAEREQVDPETVAKPEPAKTTVEPESAAKPRGKVPVKAVKSDGVASAPVAEAEKQAPARKKKGDWVVYLLSFGSKAQADRALAKYAGQLQDAEVRKAEVKGKPFYRLTVPGFASKKAALAYRSKVGRDLGLKGAWIARN